MAKVNKIYSDIDLNFTRKPGTNDVALSYDEHAVIRSIRNLMSTRRYEKPFDPEFGSTIGALLFENFSPTTASIIQDEIQNVIENYEPRATLQNVTVSILPDQNSYAATISFYVENDILPKSVTLILERTR